MGRPIKASNVIKENSYQLKYRRMISKSKHGNCSVIRGYTKQNQLKLQQLCMLLNTLHKKDTVQTVGIR